MLNQLTAQIDALDDRLVDGEIDAEEFFTTCERLLDAALESGQIDYDQYYALEMHAGF